MAQNGLLSRASMGGTILAGAFLLLAAQGTKAQPPNRLPLANEAAQSQEAAPQAAAPSTAKPNLAGTWKLNEQQSDNPREKMREAMNANGNQGDSGAMMRGRMGRRPGRGPGGRGGMLRQFSQLTIEQSDKGVNVTGATGRLIATSEPPSKQDHNAQDNGGMIMRMPPATAKWQGNQLVATSQGFGGGAITRTFELSPDGKQLYVTTKIENERFSQPVTFRFVYDPGKPESNSP